jgi:hypothetical protein
MGLFSVTARVSDRFCKSGLLAPPETDRRACRPTAIQVRRLFNPIGSGCNLNEETIGRKRDDE